VALDPQMAEGETTLRRMPLTPNRASHRPTAPTQPIAPHRQAPRVRFRDVLAATLPLILLLSIGGVQSQPMVCPGASPSLWRLPQKVECPPADWKANGNVTTLRVQIYRPNTMLYETPVHTCHCRTKHPSPHDFLWD
jgi:hypothetical protein